MVTIYTVDFIREMELEPIYTEGCSGVRFGTSDINRPGLQLAGHFDEFHGTALRLQVIGRIEMTYLKTLDDITLSQRLESYFSHPMPCVVMCRGMDIPDKMLEMAEKYKIPLFRTNLDTTSFIHKSVDYLDSKLAPCTLLHGELLDIFGVGVLLTGNSGIGKSETALELIERGHRIVTDDAVQVRKVAEQRLIGESPEITRYFMEVRGIGIIDIRAMYGVGAVISSKAIDLVIHLEEWDDGKYYDRLGLEQEYETILDVKLHRMTIPVRPGRNLAIIVEVAAKNFRHVRMGYNAVLEIDSRFTGNK